jgi:DNA N-6-adenine-methyltransferase Dam
MSGDVVPTTRRPTDDRILAAVMRMLRIDAWSFDLAADAQNTVAEHFYTEQDNALTQSWTFEGWGWCNPPKDAHADFAPWAQKAYESGSSIVMIAPVKLGSEWWLSYVHRKAHVMGLRHVHGEDGEDLVLLVYGRHVVPAYDVWDWKTGQLN